MLVGENLVLKLPKERVDELIAAGRGTRFDPGRGRVMKEWVSVSPAESKEWNRLAAEARAYIARAGAPKTR